VVNKKKVNSKEKDKHNRRGKEMVLRRNVYNGKEGRGRDCETRRDEIRWKKSRKDGWRGECKKKKNIRQSARIDSIISLLMVVPRAPSAAPKM
jgi:hypothetical protein